MEESPLLDVSVHPKEWQSPEEGQMKAILFALPQEEVMKYATIFEDVSLKPIVME